MKARMCHGRHVTIKQPVFAASRVELFRAWSKTSYLMQAARDNADCAKQEYDNALDANDPGISYSRSTLLPMSLLA